MVSLFYLRSQARLPWRRLNNLYLVKTVCYLVLDYDIHNGERAFRSPAAFVRQREGPNTSL